MSSQCLNHDEYFLIILHTCLGAVQSKKKSEITMDDGGWVQVSLGIFLFGNRPKIALNQW